MLNISKFYKHILINFLEVTICILSIFFTLYLGNEYKDSLSSLEQLYTNRANEITLSIDDKLFSSLNILSQISVAPFTEDFVTLQDYHPDITLKLYKYIANASNIISNLDLTIGVYNPNFDMVVSNQGTSSLKDFLSKFQLMEEAALKDFITSRNSKLVDSLSSNAFFTQSHHANYLCYAIRKDMLPYEPLLIIIYDTDSIITHLATHSLLNDLTFNIVNALDPKEVTEAKGHYDIHSKVLPIRYQLSFSSNTTFLFIDTLMNTLLPFIIVLLISLVLIYSFSKRLYSPVKKLVTSTASSDVDEQIVDEFEYIKQRVDTLKDTLQTYNLSSQDILLKEILYGIKKEHLKELLDDHQVHLFDSPTFMILIYAKHNLNLEVDQMALKAHIQLGLTEYNGELFEYLHYKMLPLSSYMNVLFINMLSRHDIKTLLSSLSSNLYEYQFIVTKPIVVSEIPTTFYYLNELIKNDKIGNESAVILEEDIIIRARIPYAYSEADKKHLLYNFSSAPEEEFLEFLNTIVTENLFKRDLAPLVQNEFISALCTTLNTTSKELYDTHELFNRLAMIQDKSELASTINTLFLEYYHHINSNVGKKEIKYPFIDYIHANYDKDISLTDLANEFNLAVNYVGVLFKEKTGHNFKDYLNTYRINVAKQILLDTPHIKIKDLATSVGFVNINTFIRIFKKYEAMSPGQYQKYIMEHIPKL